MASATNTWQCSTCKKSSGENEPFCTNDNCGRPCERITLLLDQFHQALENKQINNIESKVRELALVQKEYGSNKFDKHLLDRRMKRGLTPLLLLLETIEDEKLLAQLVRDFLNHGADPAQFCVNTEKWDLNAIYTKHTPISKAILLNKLPALDVMISFSLEKNEKDSIWTQIVYKQRESYWESGNYSSNNAILTPLGLSIHLKNTRVSKYFILRGAPLTATHAYTYWDSWWYSEKPPKLDKKKFKPVLLEDIMQEKCSGKWWGHSPIDTEVKELVDNRPARVKVANLILCACKFDSGCVFFEKKLPLDVLKQIMARSDLVAERYIW